jgi:AcrR family transcriptional regulator
VNVTPPAPAPASARRAELLERAYRYVLDHGLTDVSLRPLATAIGSSPRVLLYLFDSKDGLVRALLTRSRAEETELLALLARPTPDAPRDLHTATEQLWHWLAEPRRRAVLTLWVEAYARSLTEPDGPWSGFARATVTDWLRLLAGFQTADVRDSAEGAARRTLALAVLRGALLDLLATGDRERTTDAIRIQLAVLT